MSFSVCEASTLLTYMHAYLEWICYPSFCSFKFIESAAYFVNICLKKEIMLAVNCIFGHIYLLPISTEWGSSRYRGFAGEAIYFSRVNFVKTWVSMLPEGSVFHLWADLHNLIQNRRQIKGIWCFFQVTFVWPEFSTPKLPLFEHKISPNTLSLP